jgi:hypothetical protein
MVLAISSWSPCLPRSLPASSRLLARPQLLIRRFFPPWGGTSLRPSSHPTILTTGVSLSRCRRVPLPVGLVSLVLVQETNSRLSASPLKISPALMRSQWLIPQR